MPTYNFIGYSDIYSKPSGSLWQSCRDEPDLDNNGCIVNFPVDSNTIWYKF